MDLIPLRCGVCRNVVGKAEAKITDGHDIEVRAAEHHEAQHRQGCPMVNTLGGLSIDWPG